MKTTTDNSANEFKVFGRLSFPHLFEPKAIGDGKPRYTLNLLLDPKDEQQKASILAIRSRSEALALEAFKKKLPPDKHCLKKIEESEYDGYEPGSYFISAARAEKQGPPTVVDGTNGNKKLTVADNRPYAGCYCVVKIRLYTVDYDGAKRVCASIEVVQYAKKGEPFGSGSATADDMETFEEETDSLDDDDI